MNAANYLKFKDDRLSTVMFCVTTYIYLSSKIPETKDSLSVCNNYSLDVFLRPVAEHLVHVPLVLDADEHPLNKGYQTKIS